jgi:hypothetical protein
MVLKSVARLGMMLIGIVLVIGAFAAVLLLGVGTNPPPLRVAVAVRDIQVGEALSQGDYKIVEQILDPRLAAMYVQEIDATEFDGAFVVDVFRKGDPIHKQKLAMDRAALGTSRYALVLNNPDEVIMTLPVNPDIIPGKLATGDFVNILFTAGSEGGLTTLPEADDVAKPPDVPLASAEGLLDPSAPAADAPMAPETDPSTGLEASTGISPTAIAPPMALPLADLMLEHVEVLDVNYQQVQSSGYGDETGNAPAYVNGPITSIVVKVPRSHQTLLTFGISSSQLRFAIASPKMEVKHSKPELSMDWATYMAAFRWKQAQVAARGETLTQTIYPDYVALQATSSLSLTTGVATPQSTVGNPVVAEAVPNPADIPVATPAQ